MTGLPPAVMAANRPVQEKDSARPIAVAQQPAPASLAQNVRKVYTREDFASNKSWVSGFVCGKCGCQDLRVFRTERCPESRAIVRTRICRNCGEKVKTVEQ